MGSTEAQRQVSGQADNGDDRLPLQEVRWGTPVCYQEESILFLVFPNLSLLPCCG